MSRHRFVKNLTEDDYYDDDYYDEEDYWEEEENLEEKQGTDDIDVGMQEGMLRKRRRRIQDEISLKILAMNLKVKGLLDPKRASSSVEGKGREVVPSTAVEDEEVASTDIDEKSMIVDSSISNPASTSFVASSLQSVQPGTTLASLASLSLSSATGSTATRNSKFSEISLESLSSKATKTLNLTDLLKKSSPTVSTSNGLPSVSNSTAAAPSLSLFQILNSRPASLVPSSVPSQSSNKITLNDLLKSSSPSNIMSSIPHSIPAAATPYSKSSKIDSRIVCEKPSSTFARFLAVPSSSSPIATITHSALLDAVDLTSISLLDGNQVPYKFTDPSPDDIVSNARQKKPGKASSSKSATTTKSKATTSSMSKKKGDQQKQAGELNTLDSSSRDSLTKNLQSKLNISSSSVSSTNASKKNKSKINVEQEYRKRSSEQESLNLVIVGHVDAGKSTMMGHLLVQLGEINSRTISKFKKEADELKKGSFMYAWVLDATEDERSRGVTIDCAVAHFTTIGKKRRYTLLDAPGHQDFVEKMVAGTSQADVAILVVDAGAGGFESGFENGGQTREHALLLKALGVGQVIVAVNKMDLADWSMVRYDEISAKVVDFLMNVAGFNETDIQFIALSGYTGDNLVKSSKKQEANWYKGPSLVDALDLFLIPKRPINAPFVLSVQDFFKGGIGPGGGGSVTVAGRIDAGSIQVGDLVLAMPIKESGTVKAIQMGDESMSQWAVAGDRVSITLTDLDPIKIHLGSVLCSPESPTPITSRFRASISTFDLDIPLTLGVPIVLHHLGTVEAGSIISMENSADAAGKEKKRPRVISSRSKALVTIQLERPISCQTAAVSLELGRFLLRKGKTSVAAGLIIDILAFE